MTWSLFENTSPKNVFVFSRHDVNMDMFNSMVKVWDLRTRKEMAECRRTCMRNRLDYYSEDMLRKVGL